MRRFNKVYKQKKLKIFLLENKVDVIVIVEHKGDDTDCYENYTKSSTWEAVFNYKQDHIARIWLLWNTNNCSFSVAQLHDQFIGSNKSFTFTAVYGLHTILDRKQLWADLHASSQAAIEGWLIMGAFNAIMHVEDRVVRSPVQPNETADLNDFIQNATLIELKALGRDFTRTNSHVTSRIGRGLENATWVQQRTNWEVVVMEHEFSDHSPISVTIGDRHGIGPKAFKFFIFLASHQDFHRTKTWSIGHTRPSLYMVWRELSKLKGALKSLNSTEFWGIIVRINAQCSKG